MLIRSQLLASFVLLAAVATAQTPPPGELFTVEGHAMHLHCVGEGTPAVIFDAGLGDGGINFTTLLDDVGNFTRACAYDRAGYGWSEAASTPRTSVNIARELQTLLRTAGEEGPYLLVGHSFGGVNALVFASEAPEDTAGVVLIDSSHPRQFAALAEVPTLVAVQDMEIQGLRDLIPLAESGDLTAEAVLPSAPPVLTAEQQLAWAQLFVQPEQLRAAVAEYDALADGFREAEGLVDVKGVPLVVIAHGLSLADQLPAETLAALGLTTDVLERYEAIWRGLQEDLASMSSSGRLVVAEKSPHYVYYTEPELVVAAVRELVDNSRR